MSRPLRDCVCGRELVSLRVIFSVGEIFSFSRIELVGKSRVYRHLTDGSQISNSGFRFFKIQNL
jgi:hypothetical protein